MKSASKIRVGVIHSLSGTMANVETPLVSAAQMAIDEINQSGGLLGKQLEAVVEDGVSDAAVFEEKVKKLLQREKVAVLFGCWTSASRKAVKPIIEEHDALLWYPVQYEGLEQSSNIIYTGSCLNQQIEPAVNWALSKGKRNCFLVGSDYVFPRTANKLISALVTQSGGQVLDEQYIPLGSYDLGNIVNTIKKLQPHVIFNTINGDSNLAFFREFVRTGMDAKNCPIMSFSFSEILLQELIKETAGHYSCWSYFESEQTPENSRFISRFRERFGKEAAVSDPIVTAYTQVHLWKQIVEDIKSLECQDVLSKACGKSVVGPGGVMEIQANNHVKKRAMIGQANPKGQFDIVWCSDSYIEPKPWLGIEDTEIQTKNLIIEAMAQFPETMHLNWKLQKEIGNRKRAEKALRESEEKYRQLFEMESDAIFLIRQNDGQILEVNTVGTELYGYTREELLKMKNVDISAEPDATQKLTVEPKREIPLRYHRKKNGTVFPVEITANQFIWQGQEVLIAAIRDIAKRKQAEEEREKLINELQEALKEIKTLRGILPLCSFCKKIRDDKGYWERVDVYIHKHSQADISHGICPECAKKHYSDLDIYK